MKRNGQRPHFKNEGIIGGVLLCTLVGAAAAYLISSQSGRQLKSNLSNAYNGLRSQMNFKNMRHDRSRKRKLIASIAGGVLGLSALALLASETGRGIRKNISNGVKYLSDRSAELVEDIEEATEDTLEDLEERATPWIKAAKNFVEALNTSNARPSRRHLNNSTINHVADWAGLGIKLYQSLKK